MKFNKKLLAIIMIITTLIITLLIIYLQPINYSSVLAHSNQLINSADNITINYNLTLIGRYNNSFINKTSKAFYNKNKNGIKWVNELLMIEGTVYDLRPESLINLMTENLSSTGRLLSDDKTHNCYLLDDVIEGSMNKNILISDYSNARIMACFNKQTGYPVYYSLLVSGDNNLIISYRMI